MITDESIKGYMKKLHGTAIFDDLKVSEQDNIIFTSTELLKDYFEEDKLTERAIALQILYMLESDSEEFAQLKKHGINRYSVKGVTVEFSDTSSTGFVGLVSPLVAELLGGKIDDSSVHFGRLI